MDNHLGPHSSSPGALCPDQRAAPAATRIHKRIRRSEYVPKACLNCRQRKVKCSGGQTCAECEKTSDTCTYPEYRRQRRPQASQGSQSTTARSKVLDLLRAAQLSENGSLDPQNISDCVQEMTARLSQLEQDLSQASSTRQARNAPNTNKHGETAGALELQGAHAMLDMSQQLPTTDANRSRQSSQMLLPLAPGNVATEQHGLPNHHADFPMDQGVMHTSPGVVQNPTAIAPETTSQDTSMAAASTGQNMHPDAAVEGHFDEHNPPQSPKSSSDELDTGPEPRGNSSLLLLMDDLHRAVRQDVDQQSLHGNHRNNVSSDHRSPPHWGPRGTYAADIRDAEAAIRTNNGARFRACFDTAARFVNVHHPVFNENQLRAQFDDFVFSGATSMNAFDRCQFLALIFLIQAEIKMLCGSSADTSIIPGWQEFSTAEKILTPTLWLDKGNLLTVQCLVLKARFLLYIEKTNSARDTTSAACRLCFQMGLNNQPLWTGLDDFEITMRQRIFWAVLQLDRSVAYSTGLPSIIRNDDYQVDLPKCYDDRALFPGRPLPQETPQASFVPYTLGVIRWGNLYSEIWHTLFGIRAKSPISPDVYDNLEASVFAMAADLEPFLQWPGTLALQPSRMGNDHMPTYVHRQVLCLHLRTNNLRLLIRQNRMMSLKFDTPTADACFKIATDTIDAVCDYFSRFHIAADRYLCTLYVTNAMLPLSCIIVKNNHAEASCEKSIASFNKALAFMEDISRDFALSRRMIHRLQGIIDLVKRAVLSRSQHQQILGDEFNFDVDMNQFLFSNVATPAMLDFSGLVHETVGEPNFNYDAMNYPMFMQL